MAGYIRNYDGINVHESKISSYQLSPELKIKRETAEIKTWLSKSFYLMEQWATIPKEPIRTKDLSGDRKGLDSLDFRPFGIDSTDIIIVFQYSGNFRISLKQNGLDTENRVLLEKQGKSISDNDSSHKATQISYQNLLQEEWISIELPPLEVIAIYRALKIKSQLLLGL